MHDVVIPSAKFVLHLLFVHPAKVDTDLIVMLVIVDLNAKFLSALPVISRLRVQHARVDIKSIVHTICVILFVLIKIVQHVQHKATVSHVI